VLEDNDVLHMVGGGYGIYNTAQADVETAVPRTLQLLEVEVDQIMKVCVCLLSVCLDSQRPVTLSCTGDRGVRAAAAGRAHLQRTWPCVQPGAGYCSHCACFRVDGQKRI
jgi:hypothetical protein